MLLTFWQTLLKRIIAIFLDEPKPLSIMAF